jgi:hypothetical protein
MDYWQWEEEDLVNDMDMDMDAAEGTFLDQPVRAYEFTANSEQLRMSKFDGLRYGRKDRSHHTAHIRPHGNGDYEGKFRWDCRWDHHCQ